VKASLASVNIGAVLSADWAGSVGLPGIDKRPVVHRVPVSRLGIDSDEISNRRYHGTAFRALTLAPDLLAQLLEVPELAQRSAENVRKRVAA
jgi:MOSC domain-containing protein YiiM